MQEKANKQNTHVSKKNLKLPLLADDTIIYIENSKELTKKLLELINDLGICNLKLYSCHPKTGKWRIERNKWLSQYKRRLPNGQTNGKITWTAGASRNDSCSLLEWRTAWKEFEVKAARFSILDKATICHRKRYKNKENWDQKHFKLLDCTPRSTKWARMCCTLMWKAWAHYRVYICHLISQLAVS